MDATPVDEDVGAMLMKATAAAANASAVWAGRGNKTEADAAAVSAMRDALARLPISGRIIVGEGEKDDAPMLAAGESVGSGGIELELAVDPLEGTDLVASGSARALAIAGATKRDCMLDPGPSYYMQKLLVGPECAGLVDLDAPMGETVKVIANAHQIPLNEVRVAILDRPRNAELVAGVREFGAQVWLLDHGDVGPALMACLPDSDVHAVAGIGGTPEGVASACAVAALGGDLLGRVAPQRSDEEASVTDFFDRPEEIWELSDLVQGPSWFAATGVTGDDVFPAVASDETTTLVISPGEHRWIRSAVGAKAGVT